MSVPSVILVRPQLGSNIGMAARAMANCGLTDLRLVAPRDGWPNAEAAAAAAGGREIVGNAGTHPTTAEAVADLQVIYATTARRRDMEKPVLHPRTAAAEMRASPARTGVLFGAERAGLDNDDVSRAGAIIEVPLNSAFASLNLAQAVLIIAYEWAQAGVPDGPPGPSPLAEAGAFEGFWGQLNGELDRAGFYKEANLRPTTERNLRNIFTRAALTDQEVRTLRGVVARLAGGRGG